MFWEWGGICPEFPWAMISCAAALMYQPKIHFPKPSYPSRRLFYRVPQNPDIGSSHLLGTWGPSLPPVILAQDPGSYPVQVEPRLDLHTSGDGELTTF